MTDIFLETSVSVLRKLMLLRPEMSSDSSLSCLKIEITRIEITRIFKAFDLEPICFVFNFMFWQFALF